VSKSRVYSAVYNLSACVISITLISVDYTPLTDSQIRYSPTTYIYRYISYAVQHRSAARGQLHVEQ
jgi:hypothetical protein